MDVDGLFQEVLGPLNPSVRAIELIELSLESGEFTVKEKVELSFWATPGVESTTEMVNEFVANVCVGVPVISPVDASKFKPEGSAGEIE